MGSTPHAHAVAKVKNPEDQGLIAMMGVFTVCLIVTLTGLVIITTGLSSLNKEGLPLSELLSFIGEKGTGITVTQNAYEQTFGYWGNIFISVSLLFFAFSTIIGWYYYAETNVRYLCSSVRWLRCLKILVILCVFGASLFNVDLVWNMADAFNGLMVIPNIIALLILSPIVIEYTQKHVY